MMLRVDIDLLQQNNFDVRKSLSSLDKSSPTFVFIGLNYSGGIEISTKRYVKIMKSVLDNFYHSYNLVHIFEQGLSEQFVYEFYKLLLTYNIKLIFINEVGLDSRFLKILRLIPDFKSVPIYYHYHSTSGNLFRTDNFQELIRPFVENFNVKFTTPVRATYQLCLDNQFYDCTYVPFPIDPDVIDKPLVPTRERLIDFYIQKSVQPHTLKLLLQYIRDNDKTQIIRYLKDIWSDDKNDILEEVTQIVGEYKNSNIIYKPQDSLIENIDYYYSISKFYYTHPQSELSSIATLDQMVNGCVPIIHNLNTHNYTDFSDYRKYSSYQIYQSPVESDKHFITVTVPEKLNQCDDNFRKQMKEFVINNHYYTVLRFFETICV